ncbi:hypothetical protein BDV96DRAFT_567206 [Lophiotrema nucula]|uniref:N-acetyltransferase domain-containing protein n=1 Tax=Lophiotrema nucula TaxID=690887 RepID=A0A6A5ZIY2_9PLEO|nr:hypothetical protein BDV96DRAFT_567206 [Lophiotrema nucula]
MSNKPPILLCPVTYADIPALVKISADSFVRDVHTQVKGQGRKPFDMAVSANSDLLRNLANERCAYMKAIDEGTGEILGYCGWGFRLAEGYDLLPSADLGLPPVASNDEKAEKDNEDQGEAEEDSITRLCALEDADMRRWMDHFMPDQNTRCMYILSLAIATKAHGQGVGSALAEWGTDVADRLRLFTWVHSSEDAWKFYSKHGFEIVGELDIDLDEWALQPPSEEDGAKWGHYTLRYMKRLPTLEIG